MATRLTDAFLHSDFWSTDSAPAGLSARVSLWRTPGVILLFCALSYGSLFIINEVPFLNEHFPNDDLNFSPYTGTHAIPVRVFILCFMVAFSVFAAGGWLQRLRFGLYVIAQFVVYCALFDIFNIVNHSLFGFLYPLSLIAIISGVAGFYVFSNALLRLGNMPPKRERAYVRQSVILPFLLFFLVFLTSAILASWISIVTPEPITQFRLLALMGGIGPGVFLFFPLFFGSLYALNRLKELALNRVDFRPPLTIIIPAHNEAHILRQTIGNIDKAVEVYGSPVTILILNNNSTDATPSLARLALSSCKFVSGRVVDVPTPGKAHALNRGLELVGTEFFVRIDADTQVEATSLLRALRHFKDPDMGVVGGLPLVPGTGQFDRARQMETLLKHGFYQVALYPIRAVVGVAGMFAVYRTELPRRLGGFASGMNGEDTDMSLAIGESGYRVKIDPAVQFVSEVPATFKHLREQRMRWFRSVYHVTARNADYLERWWPSVRGKLMLPFMLINSARRAMMLPLVCFGLIEYITAFDSSSALVWQAILAVIIGMPALMALIACLLNRRVKALMYLPEYVLFRALRSYFTLESLLSISLYLPTTQTHKSQV
ncbi:MAG: glycosyltransferase family 2 protein [Alphaproteobacteria bacterium]|nr:glycosyltransferase family 2 protein [Alphaproteobacteria bacterium]